MAEGSSIEIEAAELRHSMANTISNIKMTNPIKGLVSKHRKRFIEDGFNLDLTCILLLLDYLRYIFKQEIILVLQYFNFNICILNKHSKYAIKKVKQT